MATKGGKVTKADAADGEMMEESEQVAISESLPAAEPEPAPETRSVEDWALARGPQPERILPTGASYTPRPIEGDRLGAMLADARGLPGARVNPEVWKFNAAKLRHGWAIGKMVTGAEYDDAISVVTDPNIVCR